MRLFGRIMPALLIALSGAVAYGQTDEFVKGEVLVKFKGTGTSKTLAVSRANAAIGASNKRIVDRLSVYQVKLPSGMQTMDAVSYYQRLPNVEYAEPNFKGKFFYTPNDPNLPQQYGPNITKCKEAWNLTKGKGTVILAIIDSGIEASHEDFQGKLVPGFDFVDNDSDPSWVEIDHGVHVAGIAAAATDNGKGGVGTGFNCKIMPLRIAPDTITSSAALIWAADHGAKVANMSYGTGGSVTEQNAINYAWGKGMVLVAASGNDGGQLQNFPAAYSNVIAVGATNAQDQRTTFSTFGDWVEVGAPGQGILSTVGGGGYGNSDGTSMASPMTVGIVGLLWSVAAPGTTNTQIRNALETTTDPISNGGFKFGRVNALKACQKLDPGSATVSPVNSATMWVGASSTGSSADLLATDSAAFTVTSTPSDIGHVAGASVDVTFNGPSSGLQEAFLLVEANSSVTGTTGQVFLWNFSSQKFTQIKAFALRPTGVKRERIALPLDLTNYVSGGELRLGIRALGPKRAPRDWPKGSFDFSLGFVQVGTRETPTG